MTIMKSLDPRSIYVWGYGPATYQKNFLENRIQSSRTLVIEAMIIPHVNIKILWKSRSDNLRAEKDMKSHSFIWKVMKIRTYSNDWSRFITVKTQTPQICLLLENLFHKHFQGKKLSFAKVQLPPGN